MTARGCQAGTDMAVKQTVLEPVAEAAKTAVARLVAVGRAVLEPLQRGIEDLQPEVPDTASESRPAGERVVEVDLSLTALTAQLREGRTVLGLNLGRLDVELPGRRNRERLGDGAQRNVR